MALEIVWSDFAKDQLDEIIEYLESSWTDKEISNFFRRLEDGIESIGKNPATYKESMRKAGVREFQLSKQTTLFYSFDEKEITILLLWTNRKDPDKLNPT